MGTPTTTSRGRRAGGWRTRLSLALALALALGAGPAVANEPEKAQGPPRGPDVPGVQSSPYKDRNRNRIYDELEAETASTPGHARIPAIVVFSHPVSDSDVESLRSEHGDFPVKARWTVVDAMSVELTKGQIVSMARRKDVVQIEGDAVVKTTMETARRWYGVDKAVADFGVTGDRSGNNKVFTKADVVACVVDTGIATSHADLNEGQVIGWKDFVNNAGFPYDDNGHGTHVAGILAGQGDGEAEHRGVAPGAALVGVKVLSAIGSGTISAVLNGVNFCVSQKATYNIRIINLSLTSSGSSDGTDSLSLAVNNAFDAGILPVVAAGNGGPDVYTIGSPGAAAKALTVCSLADPGELGFFVSNFSSRGPTADGRSKPDVCAPGHNVTAPLAGSVSSYTTFSGTSMASPFVGGVAALLLDANNGLTPSDLKSRIRIYAQDWRIAGADNDTGKGRLQAYALIRDAGGFTGTGPPVPAHYMTDKQTLAGKGAADKWSFPVGNAAYPIALTLIVPGASLTKDFDLYLYGPGGAMLDQSEFGGRQETVSFKPLKTGTYQVAVSSFSGSGTYFLDLSYGGAAPSLVVNQ